MSIVVVSVILPIHFNEENVKARTRVPSKIIFVIFILNLTDRNIHCHFKDTNIDPFSAAHKGFKYIDRRLEGAVRFADPFFLKNYKSQERL